MRQRLQLIRWAALPALLALGLLSGCGHKTLEGTYLPNGEQSYTYDKLTFSPDGTVVASFNGKPLSPRGYKIVDKQVQLQINQWPHNLNMRDDGCLVGTGESNMHGVYCKPQN